MDQGTNIKTVVDDLYYGRITGKSFEGIAARDGSAYTLKIDVYVPSKSSDKIKESHHDITERELLGLEEEASKYDGRKEYDGLRRNMNEIQKFVQKQKIKHSLAPKRSVWGRLKSYI